MEIVKTTDEYTIIKKRNGRYGVRRKNGNWVNKDEKVKILVEEGLIKASLPKQEEAPAEEAPQEETPSEEASATE